MIGSALAARSTGSISPDFLTAMPTLAHTVSAASDATYSATAIIRRLAIGVTLLNLFVALLAVLSLAHSRQQYESRAAVATQNLVQVLEHDITASFDKIDLTLQTVSDEMHRQRRRGPVDAATLNAFIARQQQRLQAIDGIRVATASGDVVFGTGLGNGERPNIGDREYFIRLRDDPQAGLVISQPVVSRLNGKQMILVGRRLTDADQRFAGIVYAAMLLDHFNRIFAAINLGDQGAVSLRDEQLALVARYPNGQPGGSQIGSTAVSEQFQQMLRQSPQAGTFDAVIRLDGIERTNSYRHLATYPFYVIVGQATADYLREWRHEVLRSIAVIALFSLASLFFFWLIRRAWRQQEAGIRDLARQEVKFRTLLDSTPDALIIANAAGLIVLVNKQAEATFGYHREELCGQEIGILLPARLRASHAAQVNGFTAQPDLREMSGGRDLLAVTKSGREFPVTISLSPIESEQGRLIAAAIRDVSERVKANTRLTHLTRLYAVLSKANKAIIRQRQIEPLLEEICRIAVEEGAFIMAWAGRLEDGDIVPFARWGQDDGYVEQAARIYAEQKDNLGPISRARQEGTYAICDDMQSDPRMAPWRELALARGYRSSGGFPIWQDGELIGVINLYAPEPYFFTAEVQALLSDLCEDIAFALDAMRQSELRQRAEVELRQLNEELEWRVAERTRALEDANRELESFSYSVSHDLRAPLRSIDGFSQVLLRRYHDRLDDTGRDYLDRVRRASQRMGQLIDDLLDLSRVSRGPLQRQEANLSALARQVVDELARNDPDRQVAISIEDGLNAYCDPGLLRVVLDNLLGNAWKFTRHGTAAAISFSCHEENGQKVYCVRDNGVGFDPAYAKKLFNVFQRLHSQDEFEGTGIGLATVRRVIRRHHGQVWAEAAPGAGAALYFSLPQRSEAREDEGKHSARSTDRAAIPEHRGEKQ